MARPPTEDDIRRIYRETIDPLYAFVARRCGGDRSLAEDVTQDAWLRAIPAWRRGGLPDRPLAWLTTVAARVLSNHSRRPAMATFDDEAGDGVAHEPMDAEQRTERRNLIERALARLPAAQARLLEAFHFDRRAVAEIAESDGLSERAVEGRLRRARQHLRREVEQELAAEGEER